MAVPTLPLACRNTDFSRRLTFVIAQIKYFKHTMKKKKKIKTPKLRAQDWPAQRNVRAHPKEITRRWSLLRPHRDRDLTAVQLKP